MNEKILKAEKRLLFAALVFIIALAFSCKKETARPDKVFVKPVEEVLSLADNDTTKPGTTMWYPTPTCQCWRYEWDITYNKFRWFVVGDAECQGLPNNCRVGLN